MSRTADADIIVGGQAVLEGVMMRSPNAYAVSVRRPDGTLACSSSLVPRLSEVYPFLKLPIVRGSATLIQSMALGIKALNFSSTVALEEEDDDKSGGTGAGASAMAAGSLVFALAVNIVLFILLPLVLTNVIFWAAGAGVPGVEAGAAWTETAWAMVRTVRPTFAFNFVEGLVRVALFLALIFGMSRLPDMHRVFQYHGAEHKVVMNYEAGLPLTVENARSQPRRHPRCGTSFLMVVMIVAIVLFSVVTFDTLLANAAARIALLPLVAGLSFEVIRAAARKQSGPIFRAMVLPGLWLQGVTTQEPTDDQLEVAIDALERSLALEPRNQESGVRSQEEVFQP
jgi:uncharacterized protein YqhQ